MGNRNRYKVARVIEAIQRARGIKAVTAKILGCSRQTVDNYIERYATVRSAYEEQRETLIDVAEGKLIKKLDEDEWAAIKFVLMTLGKGRGYTQRIETELLNMDVSQLTDEQLERIAAGENPMVVFASPGGS